MCLNPISASLGKCCSLFCTWLAGMLSATGARRHPQTRGRAAGEAFASAAAAELRCAGLLGQWGCTGCSAVTREGLWVLCPGRHPLQPQVALLQCCSGSSAACCFLAAEGYRNGRVDFCCVQFSPWLKSVVEVLVMPKAIKLGCFSPSGFVYTVGSPWVWSTPDVQHGKQRCM